MQENKINLEKERWNRAYKEGVKFGQHINIKISEIINNLNDKNLKVLDIGCGAGELSLFLNKNGCAVVGSDISDVAINKAKILNGDNNANVEFLVGDINEIKDNFDIVVCKLVYAFVQDKKEFLEKVKSILNTNGRLIISTPVITVENKDKVLKPGICIAEESIQELRDNFSKVNLILESQDNYGDNYIIECAQ